MNPLTILKTRQTSHNLLHSFCLYPSFNFDGQHSDEQVILVLRAHPITQIFWLINTIILGIVLLIIDYFFPAFLNYFQYVFFNIFSLAFIFAYMWFNFLSWFFNVGIITNERVIDIDFSSVLYKEITETQLNRIQDLTNKSGGFLESFVNFGNLFIQTAGTEANIEFLNIPKPSLAASIINELLDEKKRQI
jgi:uncharacterized membrane protein YdbT with pleckstrin-like domain